jgi:hypothetical protein
MSFLLPPVVFEILALITLFFHQAIAIPIARDGLPPTPLPTATSTATPEPDWPIDRQYTAEEVGALAAAAGLPVQFIDEAVTIARCESGFRPWATGPFGERGFWQIHPAYHPDSTYDPLGNAEAMVRISGGGVDWSPWVCNPY